MYIVLATISSLCGIYIYIYIYYILLAEHAMPCELIISKDYECVHTELSIAFAVKLTINSSAFLVIYSTLQFGITIVKALTKINSYGHLIRF